MDTLCPIIKWANIARRYLRSKLRHWRDLSLVKLFVPFCPYIMGTVLRGQTDCSAPIGSCFMPSLAEEYGGAWNNINCSLYGTQRLRVGHESNSELSMLQTKLTIWHFCPVHETTGCVCRGKRACRIWTFLSTSPFSLLHLLPSLVCTTECNTMKAFLLLRKCTPFYPHCILHRGFSSVITLMW